MLLTTLHCCDRSGWLNDVLHEPTARVDKDAHLRPSRSKRRHSRVVFMQQAGEIAERRARNAEASVARLLGLTSASKGDSSGGSADK
jgi:hypothetical protein